MKHVIIILVVLSFIGCKESHYVKQACLFNVKHPEIVDSLAQKWYPPTYTTKHDTTYLAGIPSVETDTMQVHDSFIVNGVMFIHDTTRITKTKKVIDTVKLNTINFIRDTAQISFLLGKVNKDTASLQSSENSLSMWRKIALIAIAVILIQNGYKFALALMSKYA